MGEKCFGRLFYINKTKELYHINAMLKASFDPNSEGKNYKKILGKFQYELAKIYKGIIFLRAIMIFWLGDAC